MRMHVCWGNYPGPDRRDIPLERIASRLLWGGGGGGGVPDMGNM
jgi:hypothetical protein